ncbi:MAG TPA: hypothetical protein VH333_24265 [Pseudonocardiaceae bacterium]|jgi:hypothetical protein|nr:hypothetical protein [Pseudonocardiaceae bacterium]
MASSKIVNIDVQCGQRRDLSAFDAQGNPITYQITAGPVSSGGSGQDGDDGGDGGNTGGTDLPIVNRPPHSTTANIAVDVGAVDGVGPALLRFEPGYFRNRLRTGRYPGLLTAFEVVPGDVMPGDVTPRVTIDLPPDYVEGTGVGYLFFLGIPTRSD